MGKPLFIARQPELHNQSSGIRRVLIANRGEISCRIIRTCRLLGIASVAIYTDEDARSRHVAEADEAISLGSINQEHGNPFLNISLLIEVAKRTAVDAIHPGYGYLSENAAFADAARDAGIIFIGPRSQSVLTLGDKRQSKEFLRQHCPSIPLIPGFDGRSQELTQLEKAADVIGYPVMLKASAGGGGKGIRIIQAKDELKASLERAQSEAQRSFGLSDCILEKYINAGKHVEVQIIGDAYGNVISLFERECSVQRRHQKIIEESPCPWLTQEMRRAMCNAACDIGRAVQYEGAGTVEFLIDVKTSQFYFLEVNSRIQVEHPITEEVTGVDIVALQVFVAAAGNLKQLPLDGISQTGHAIECRLCAENPQQKFLPQLGTIHLWKPAVMSDDIRYETAVTSGTELTMAFDPLIAKVVVWAPDRESAITKMVNVLANLACVGLITNQIFLQSCLLHPGFHDFSYNTFFVDENLQELLNFPYREHLEGLQTKLIAIPASHLAGQGLTTPHFRNISKRFRNQSQDKVNVLNRVLTITSQNFVAASPLWTSPVLCTWPHQRGVRLSRQQMYQKALAPIFERVQSSQEYQNCTGPQRLAAMYNAISNFFRTDTVYSQPPISVNVISSTTIDTQHQGDDPNISIEMSVEINETLITGILVILDWRASSAVGVNAGPSQRMMFHSPLLGTWIAFEACDILSYFESIRSVTGDTTDDKDKSFVNAPMPCKVLRLLKQNGDNVRAGDTVLVIESMKMEIAISVKVAGQLNCALSEGQAIAEGDLLCSVE